MQSASVKTELGKFMEDATMAYNGLKVDEYTTQNYTITNADIIAELISNFGYEGKITEVTAGEASSITIGNIGQVVVGDTTTVGINKVGANSIYFVEIKGKYYPIHFETTKITVVESEAQDSAIATDADVSFSTISLDTNIVEATAKNIEGVLTVDLIGKSRGTTEITVKYGNIEQKVNVSVKGKTQITFVAETDSSGNAKGTITSPTTATAEYVDGEKITLTAEGIGDNSLLGWYIGNIQINVDENNQYIVPDNLVSPITIKAKFGEKGIYVSFEESTGTLRFYDHSGTDTETEVFYRDSSGNGKNIKNETYYYNNGKYRPWNGETDNIIKVIFENKIFPSNTIYWLYGMKNLIEIQKIENLDTSNTFSLAGLFGGCAKLTTIDLSGFDTSNVTEMSNMFSGCSGLTSLDVGGFDTSKVIYMGYMFSECSGLTSIDVSKFDTSKVESMSYMFCNCTGLTNLDLSSFDTTSLTAAPCMFNSCSGLTSLDVSNFNTINLTNANSMFTNCSGLQSLDVSWSNTSSLVGVSNMFTNCSNLTNLKLFNLTSTTNNCYSMFSGCASLTSLDLSGFDTSSVTRMSYMFMGCKRLKTIYVSNSFVTTSTSSYNSESMFYGCTNLVGGNGTTWNNANYVDKTYARIDKEGEPGYFTDISQKPTE